VTPASPNGAPDPDGGSDWPWLVIGLLGFVASFAACALSVRP
jgi:hypothetical protein